MSVEPTRAILFDLVGVLLFRREDHVPDERVDALDELIGRTTNDTSLRMEALDRFDLTGMEFDQLISRVAAKYTAFPAIWELLPDLKKRFRLGIINNGTYLTYADFNARYGLEQNFDLYLSSAREGMCKPDIRIFQLACRRLGVRPGQCLFMDDTLENTGAAGELGMKTLHWPDPQSGLQRFKEWIQNEPG